MVFHLLTIFPEFFSGPFACGIVARAREAGRLSIVCHNPRDFTFDRHRSVDDRPFGGDEGMVLKVEPIDRALRQVRSGWSGKKTRTVLLSAQGKLYNQAAAARYAELDEIALICGRYEGVDERISEHLCDEEISVGDFILSGGEWAAGMVADSVARLLPGVVGNESSTRRESFAPLPGGGVGLLDCPHYTRPAVYGDWKTPEVLLSGDHEKIRRWRREAALRKTLRNRPELLETAPLSSEDREILRRIREGGLESASAGPRED